MDALIAAREAQPAPPPPTLDPAPDTAAAIEFEAAADAPNPGADGSGVEDGSGVGEGSGVNGAAMDADEEAVAAPSSSRADWGDTVRGYSPGIQSGDTVQGGAASTSVPLVGLVGNSDLEIAAGTDASTMSVRVRILSCLVQLLRMFCASS